MWLIFYISILYNKRENRGERDESERNFPCVDWKNIKIFIIKYKDIYDI